MRDACERARLGYVVREGFEGAGWVEGVDVLRGENVSRNGGDGNGRGKRRIRRANLVLDRLLQD